VPLLLARAVSCEAGALGGGACTDLPRIAGPQAAMFMLQGQRAELASQGSLPQVRLCARSAVALAPAAVPSLALLAPALLPAVVAPARAGRCCRACATVQFANDSSRPAVPRLWREGPRSGVAFRVQSTQGHRPNGPPRDRSRLPPTFAERKPLSTDWPARGDWLQQSGSDCAPLRLRWPPQCSVRGFTWSCGTRTARSIDPLSSVGPGLSAPSSSGIRRTTSIRTLCSRGFPSRLKFVLGAKVRALPCQVRSSHRA
jgi:hypothetical protein